MHTPRHLGITPLRCLRHAAVLAALSALCSPLFSQTNTEDRRRGGGDRGNFNPQEMQARMMTSLRERLEVPDDEEWKLISERLTKVMELRRSTAGGAGGFSMFGGRGGPPGGGDTGGRARTGGTRGSTGGNTELAALGTALRDKLPDAEIKSRLDRVRETRKENEVKLAKAQEELRALLSVRQEAMAVVAGLLP